jgi:hypothetical protein
MRNLASFRVEVKRSRGTSSNGASAGRGSAFVPGMGQGRLVLVPIALLGLAGVVTAAHLGNRWLWFAVARRASRCRP